MKNTLKMNVSRNLTEVDVQHVERHTSGSLGGEIVLECGDLEVSFHGEFFQEGRFPSKDEVNDLVGVPVITAMSILAEIAEYENYDRDDEW